MPDSQSQTSESSPSEFRWEPLRVEFIDNKEACIKQLQAEVDKLRARVIVLEYDARQLMPRRQLDELVERVKLLEEVANGKK